MRIGIDFDNTIACYDTAFYEVALEKNWIDPKILKSKVSVKTEMHKKSLFREFTILQGLVYGKNILKAKLFEGFRNFLAENIKFHEFFIISHKTRYPIIGEKIDLHLAAHKFIKFNKLEYFYNDLNERIFLEPVKEKKIKRTNTLNLDFFIDDLSEILEMDGFLKKTKKLLFDPNHKTSKFSSFKKFSSWEEINIYFRSQ